MPDEREPIASDEPAVGAAMGFFEHLEELRRRLLHSLVAIAICLVLGLAFWQEIYTVVAAPMLAAFESAGMEKRLVFTGPLVPIRFALQIGLYAGIFLAAPYIFWQVWLFIAPGLYRRERRVAMPFVLSSTALFILGCYFAHRVVLPLTLTFLLEFGKGYFEPLITINEYFSLWLTMVLWMGIIFELPILIFILSWLGLVTPRFLIHYFRHAVIAIVVIAAVVTPTTDAFTMTVFAAPMIALYILGIGVSWLVHLRRTRARHAAEAEN